jgi:dihydrofolate synthase/folylpolyglutamate synthase
VLSAERFLNSLINYERSKTFDYNFKLRNFQKFLDSIGNPERRLSNVILIAGTKGKGSTAAFIESALRASGLKTGLYTSPHIFSIKERIKVNNIEIAPKDLDRLTGKIKLQAKRFDITFFEAITAIAFLYFIGKKTDYTVLEVGLGGRLDATNVVTPKVSVITRIGYDHTDLLGKTLGKISREKAGIIHPESFVVIAKQRPTALKVIKDKIRECKNNYIESEKAFKVKNIRTSISGTEFSVTNIRIGFPVLSKPVSGKRKYKIKLIGKHQVENTCTALAVLQYLQKQDQRITGKGITFGLESADILARSQIISKNPTIIIDGAHNPESILALCDVIHNIIKKKVIIFGSSQGKLVEKMIKILAPVTSKFILTQSTNPRAIPSSEIAKIIKPSKIPLVVTKSVFEALKQVPQNEPFIVTGSFYVASEALMILEKI